MKNFEMCGLRIMDRLENRGKYRRSVNRSIERERAPSWAGVTAKSSSSMRNVFPECGGLQRLPHVAD